jgi:hypothetical protein
LSKLYGDPPIIDTLAFDDPLFDIVCWFLNCLGSNAVISMLRKGSP